MSAESHSRLRLIFVSYALVGKKRKKKKEEEKKRKKKMPPCNQSSAN